MIKMTSEAALDSMNRSEPTNQAWDRERVSLKDRIAELEQQVRKVEEIERAHRQTEDQFRKVFDYSNDAILILDPAKDQILEANPKACEILKFSRAELLLTPISSIHPAEMPRLLSFARSVFERGSGWTNELSCLTKSGASLPAEISASVIDMNGRRRLIAMVRDITERKRAEPALRESERKFQTMARISPAIIFQADAVGRILYVNEQWRQLTGRSADAALGEEWLRAVIENDRERIAAEWRQAVQQGAPWKSEFRIQSDEGSVVWMLGQAAVEPGDRDQVVGFVGTFTDITEIKRAGQLELENAYLQEEVIEARAFGEIVGKSAALRTLLRQIEMVAPTDASVLILGESGTGKELVAREIHKRSRRNRRQLVRVNCASIPRELYESEFFGHIKGAFTGAVKDRAGRFEAADGGSLFLDEVGEIPLEMQSKLLRVLQEGQYERVGEERTREVNVRIIAATNRDLKAEVEAGRFRQDLYYRLNVFPITVAPLRERKGDIPSLAAHFLKLAAKNLKCPLPKLTEAHIAALQSYDWPGNVRELQNVIERAVIIAGRGALHFDLPSRPQEFDHKPAVSMTDSGAGEVISEVEMRRRERENTVAALNKAGWKVHGPGGAAELLGIKPTTLFSRMRKMKLKPPE